MNLNKFQPLETWLKENERSKSWLARKINVSPSLMNLMIAGKRTMSEYHKSNICYVTEMPADELFPQ
jgi:DNA-binding transcriptional regulator YdaS (Cro superfamily)